MKLSPAFSQNFLSAESREEALIREANFALGQTLFWKWRKLRLEFRP